MTPKNLWFGFVTLFAVATFGTHAAMAANVALCSKDFVYTFKGPLNFTSSFATIDIAQAIAGNNAIVSATWSPTPTPPSAKTKALLGAIKGITPYYGQGGTAHLYLLILPSGAAPSFDATGAQLAIHEMYARFDGPCQ